MVPSPSQVSPDSTREDAERARYIEELKRQYQSGQLDLSVTPEQIDDTLLRALFEDDDE